MFSIVIIPLVIGYLLDLIFGDPRKLPHPIVAFGNIIGWCERHFNKGKHKKRNGCLVALILPLSTLLLGGLIAWGSWLLHPLAYYGVASVFVFYGLANHSLIQEGGEVIRTLEEQGLEAGRKRLSWIVGRDTSQLPPKKIYTAVLETMAENLSDGVVAPLFFYALGGFPAMMTYKMVNTLDSMIGYKDARYKDFGCCAELYSRPANSTSDCFSRLPERNLLLHPKIRPPTCQSQLRLPGIRHGRNTGLPLRGTQHLSRNSRGKTLYRDK